MSFTIYDASAPVFVHALTNIQTWLDKALAEGKSETALVEARLAPDMLPFTRQIQISSDTAKNAVARLLGLEAPSMPDTETTFAELKDRCQRTIDYLNSFDRKAFDGAEARAVQLKFPNGMGYNFTGAQFLTGFALPNFFFHVTTTYALLRKEGVSLGKPDFLQHLGMPEQIAA
jgi:hypothetical protein